MKTVTISNDFSEHDKILDHKQNLNRQSNQDNLETKTNDGNSDTDTSNIPDLNEQHNKSNSEDSIYKIHLNGNKNIENDNQANNNEIPSS